MGQYFYPTLGIPNTGVGGWTTINPTLPSGQGSGFSGAGSRLVYVSSSTGNNANPGTLSSPVATLAAGAALLRNGFPDQLLLKKGDTWTGERFGLGYSGVSAGVVGQASTGPILISSYGTGARPLIKTDATDSTAINSQRDDGTGNFIAIIGVEFYSYTRDPNNVNFSAAGLTTEQTGFNILNAIDWFLVEDCKFSFYENHNFSPNGGAGNLAFRRNIVVDNYNARGSHAQGIFVSQTAGVLIEENLFDHNGWNSAAVLGGAGDANTFNHNVYLAVDTPNLIFQRNISANASLTGAQLRGGGTGYNNLLVHNPVGMNYGTYGGPVTYNVISESCDIVGTFAAVHGEGISLNPSSFPTICDHNLIINSVSSGGNYAITIGTLAHTGDFQAGTKTILNVPDPSGAGLGAWVPGPNALLTGADLAASTLIASGSSGFSPLGASGTVAISLNATGTGTVAFSQIPYQTQLTNNYIFNQLGGIIDGGSGTVQSGNVNDASGTNGGAAPEPFPAPSRSVGSYAGTIGLAATLTGFLTAARAQSKDNWNPALTANAVNNYIRAGYGVAAQ